MGSIIGLKLDGVENIVEKNAEEIIIHIELPGAPCPPPTAGTVEPFVQQTHHKDIISADCNKTSG